MITKKEDLINTYIDHSNRELFSIWLELVKDVVEKDGASIHWLKQNKYCSVESSVSGELFVNSIDGIWLKGKRELKLSDFKRTRTEYEKVTYSSAWKAAKDHEERKVELWRKSDLNEAIKGNNWKAIQSPSEAAQYHFDLYRKVEKEIDWRKEVKGYLKSDNGAFKVYQLEAIFGAIAEYPERYLEHCRVALRANGEIE